MLQNIINSKSAVPAWKVYATNRIKDQELQAYCSFKRSEANEIEEDLPGLVPAVQVKKADARHSEKEWDVADLSVRMMADQRRSFYADEIQAAAQRVESAARELVVEKMNLTTGEYQTAIRQIEFKAISKKPVLITVLRRFFQDLFYFRKASLRGSYKIVKCQLAAGRYPLWKRDEIKLDVAAAFDEARAAKFGF